MRELEREPSRRARRSAGDAALPRLAIVGAGRVGTALARALRFGGADVALHGRDLSPLSAARPAAVLLCVPDAAIPEAAAAVAEALPGLAFIGHTSGASGLDALACDGRAAAFSLHPLQTIPDGEADLTGAPSAIAGATPAAEALARRLAEAAGMRPFTVPDERRPAYHAAAVMASNFLVALEESASELLASLGVGDARELLAPLVLRSAANWAERGERALTGPIARGDEATVERHRAALAAEAPALLPLYDALAERTRALAGRIGAGA